MYPTLTACEHNKEKWEEVEISVNNLIKGRLRMNREAEIEQSDDDEGEQWVIYKDEVKRLRNAKRESNDYLRIEMHPPPLISQVCKTSGNENEDYYDWYMTNGGDS